MIRANSGLQRVRLGGLASWLAGWLGARCAGLSTRWLSLSSS